MIRSPFPTAQTRTRAWHQRHAPCVSVPTCWLFVRPPFFQSGKPNDKILLSALQNVMLGSGVCKYDRRIGASQELFLLHLFVW